MAIEIRKFIFDQPADGVSAISLDDVESKLGGKLDQDYREFLSKIDGGRPDPALMSSIKLLPFPILVFLGVTKGKSNILEDYEDLNQTIGTAGLLPIAYDSSFSRICLQIGLRRSPVVVVFVDYLYGREPTTITPVCGSFFEFWQSLYQPQKLVPMFEELSERSWNEIKSLVSTDPEYYLGSGSDELTLLCQVIRAENDEAFRELVLAGAKLDGALEVAVTNKRLDFVETLVESGANAADGLRFAVGPSRKKIREYLERHIQ